MENENKKKIQTTEASYLDFSTYFSQNLSTLMDTFDINNHLNLKKKQFYGTKGIFFTHIYA